jgi:hypothetical protein
VVSPNFKDHGGLLTKSEPHQRQTFVSRLTVDAFAGTVLQGLPGMFRVVAVRAWEIHSLMEWLKNSWPLSDHMNKGAP